MENEIVGDAAALAPQQNTQVTTDTSRDITYGDSQSGVSSASSVASNAENVGGVNVANFAGQLVGDPSAFFSNDMKLSNQVPTIDGNAPGTQLDASNPNYFIDAGKLNVSAAQGNTATATAPEGTPTATTTAATSFDRISQDQNQMKAAQGEVRDEAILKTEQLDMQGMGTGTNADGSINYAGQALNKFASQNISTLIDTSTVSGKLLAQTLGEGNYTDTKATVQGQLDILTKEFTDPVTGEPKIPTWAAGVVRNVSRIAAFKGVSGTAATSAIAQAMIEATLPIAQADAQFFQTVTLKNLDNKQQQVINTANVLSKMELTNMEVRVQTAVENAKNFMQMDLTNLNNEQQSRVINTQARVQSILEDTKAENTSRLFNAQSKNDMDKFYDNLRASISSFNASQKNSMEQFNVGQTNSTAQFNAQIENNREQFYKTMQYNIDIANSKWRQAITLQNAEMEFQAAATDVKNMVGLSTEQLNQLWDRSDALLDFAWKQSENTKERDYKIAVAKEQAQVERDKVAAASKGGGIGSIIGTVAGMALGSVTGGVGGAFGKLAGAALGSAMGFKKD